MTAPAPAVTEEEIASRIDMGHGWSFEPEPLLDGYLHLYREGYGVVGRNTIYKPEDAQRIAAAVGSTVRAATSADDGLRAELEARRSESEDHLNDLRRLLRALGLSDHARPIPSAEVFDACLRDIEGLRQRVPDAEADALRLHREKMDWFDRATTAEAELNAMTAEARRWKREYDALAAAFETVPPEILALLPDIAEGEVRALPFSYDYGHLGPDWFLAGGEPFPGNMGGDFEEADAKFAAFAWNRTRAQITAQLAARDQP